jgi:Family of unknown function (DUF6455)
MGAESAMAVTRTREKSGIITGLLQGWASLRAELARFHDLHSRGMKSGVPTDARVIPFTRPMVPGELRLRLEALDLHRALLRMDVLVIRDLERTCTSCMTKQRCRRDWLSHPDDEAWRRYCRNAPTLAALRAGLVAA